MDNTLTEKWLQERNIILDKSFVAELQTLIAIYKKQFYPDFE